MDIDENDSETECQFEDDSEIKGQQGELEDGSKAEGEQFQGESNYEL